MIKAVLFDFDDTLFKTIDIRVKAIKDAAYRFYKIRLTEKQGARTVSKLKEILSMLN